MLNTRKLTPFFSRWQHLRRGFVGFLVSYGCGQAGKGVTEVILKSQRHERSIDFSRHCRIPEQGREREKTT
jgi:hypothetical protein